MADRAATALVLAVLTACGTGSPSAAEPQVSSAASGQSPPSTSGDVAPTGSSSGAPSRAASGSSTGAPFGQATPLDDASASSRDGADAAPLEVSGETSVADDDDAATAPAAPSGDGGSTLGPGPPGCANPLGGVWTVTEAGNGCMSTWTRQGTSSTFDVREVAPCNVTATATVTLTGSDVSAFWITSSDEDDCNYVGMLNATCTTIAGDYTCTSADAGSGVWSVAIR